MLGAYGILHSSAGVPGKNGRHASSDHVRCGFRTRRVSNANANFQLILALPRLNHLLRMLAPLQWWKGSCAMAFKNILSAAGLLALLVASAPVAAQSAPAQLAAASDDAASDSAMSQHQ